MADTVRGNVIAVIDGDTFELEVTHIGNHNKSKYNDQERIRLAGSDAPELGNPAGQQARQQLHWEWMGREVRCHVQARDKYHRLVCKVEYVN